MEHVCDVVACDEDGLHFRELSLRQKMHKKIEKYSAVRMKIFSDN